MHAEMNAFALADPASPLLVIFRPFLSTLLVSIKKNVFSCIGSRFGNLIKIWSASVPSRRFLSLFRYFSTFSSRNYGQGGRTRGTLAAFYLGLIFK